MHTAPETSIIAPPTEKKEEVGVKLDDSKPSFTMKQVAQHSTEVDPWIVVNGRVYDCTKFLRLHPGGADSILINAGTDCTEEFAAIHSKKAWTLLEEYYIGQVRMDDDSTPIDNDSIPSTSLSTPSIDASMNVALNPRVKVSFPLIERTQLSPDTIRMRFGLPSPTMKIGLPVGQHMLFSCKINGSLVMRAYTPTSSDHDLAYFELVIKVYKPNKESLIKFPNGGQMSQYLGAMKIGDTIDVKGPIGHVIYKSPGVISIDGLPSKVNTFVMLCAGTGITPMYQILSEILRPRLLKHHGMTSNEVKEDGTKIFMIFANRYEEDILLRSELDEYRKLFPDQFQIEYILSRPNDGWSGHMGHVNLELIQKSFPLGQNHLLYGKSETAPPPIALLCGPPGFIDDVCIPSLEKHGYDAAHRVLF